jgi:hypothetical protein
MHEGALAFEHTRHVTAQRLGADENQPQKDRDLQNPNASHKVSLELLRTKQRVDQVDKQPQRRDSSDDVVHKFPLELVAGLGEDPAEKQKSTADCHVE